MKSIKTKVVHSQSKNAFNVVCMSLGVKYKIARVPYFLCGHAEIDENEKQLALNHAEFISFCFNNAEVISKMQQ